MAAPGNPFASHTPEYVDFELWSMAHHNPRGSGELEFLRGVHSSTGVAEIKAFLVRLGQPGLIRVSSIWLDKYPIVVPHAASGCSTDKREIGDLAVVVRQSHPDGLSIRMWILQAKVAAPNWQGAGSSAKEIELYERLPAFDLYSSQHAGARKIDSFDLALDFGAVNPVDRRFWSYLLFKDNSPGTSAVTPADPSPMRAQWRAKGPHDWSFAERLESALTSGSPQHRQTQVHPRVNPEWRRLYRRLWRFASRKKSVVLPGGPWIRTAMQILDGPGVDLALGHVTARPFDRPLWSGVPEGTFGTTGFGLPAYRGSLADNSIQRFFAQVSQFDGGDDGPPDEEGFEEDGGSGVPMLVVDQIQPE